MAIKYVQIGYSMATGKPIYEEISDEYRVWPTRPEVAKPDKNNLNTANKDMS